MGTKLFVGNLPFNTTDQELRDFFSRVGVCESAVILTDRATGRSRGFGFVEMATEEEAQRAITELNQTDLQGRAINVTVAREKGEGRPRSPSSGGPFRGFRDDPPRGGAGVRKEGGSRRGLRGRKRSL
jgi:RNA recognition motif-containing protein